jgi:hypothetical protein
MPVVLLFSFENQNCTIVKYLLEGKYPPVENHRVKWSGSVPLVHWRFSILAAQ